MNIFQKRKLVTSLFLQVKDASLDEFCSKLSTAEREWKRLSKEVSALQTQGSKLRELERDNKELQQSSIVEHKTLAAIRYIKFCRN